MRVPRVSYCGGHALRCTLQYLEAVLVNVVRYNLAQFIVVDAAPPFASVILITEHWVKNLNIHIACIDTALMRD